MAGILWDLAIVGPKVAIAVLLPAGLAAANGPAAPSIASSITASCANSDGARGIRGGGLTFDVGIWP